MNFSKHFIDMILKDKIKFTTITLMTIGFLFLLGVVFMVG